MSSGGLAALLHGSAERVDRRVELSVALAVLMAVRSGAEVTFVRRRGSSPVARPGVAAASLVFTVIGVLAIGAALFLWGFGSQAERGLAGPVGWGGFSVLCFSNAVAAFSRATNRDQRSSG